MINGKQLCNKRFGMDAVIEPLSNVDETTNAFSDLVL